MSARAGWLAIAALVAAAIGGACGNAESASDSSTTTGGGSSGGANRGGAFFEDCRRLGLSNEDCQSWSKRVLPEALPAARGNRFADDEDAAKLGYALFFDLDALSPLNVRCVACHSPDHAFAGDIPLPTGAALAERNALPLVDAARTFPHFWDGRADSLWSQSLVAIENDDEMRGTRLGVAHRVASAYGDLYGKVFGALPNLDDGMRFPAAGKPGDAAWEAMTAKDRAAVTVVFVNVGKAMEAYVRKIAAGRSAFDRYLAADVSAISASAKRGLEVFQQAGCVRCHAGATFSDGNYHRLDLPLPEYPAYQAQSAKDRGRAQGIPFLLASEFNALSPYFDRSAGEKPHLEEDTTAVGDGFFLTPSLRNVSATGPYGHNGTFLTLEEVIRFKFEGGGGDCKELTPFDGDDDDVHDVAAFLATLRGSDAPLQWSAWPMIDGTGGYGGSN